MVKYKKPRRKDGVFIPMAPRVVRSAKLSGLQVQVSNAANTEEESENGLQACAGNIDI